jgi:hypothetical protein
MIEKKQIEIIARIGVFGTFISHGFLAFNTNPGWIKFITCYGFSDIQARLLMPIIGVVDITVAFIILIYPIRIIVFWAFFWAFLTALSRPIVGLHYIEFVERSANWVLPLVLLLLQGFPKNFKDFFKIRT